MNFRSLSKSEMYVKNRGVIRALILLSKKGQSSVRSKKTTGPMLKKKCYMHDSTTCHTADKP